MCPCFYRPKNGSWLASEKGVRNLRNTQNAIHKPETQPSPLHSLRGNQREIFKHVFWLMSRAAEKFRIAVNAPSRRVAVAFCIDLLDNYRGATASDSNGLPFV